MKSEDLLYALNDINEVYIAEAEPELAHIGSTFPRRGRLHRILTAAGIAAALLLGTFTTVMAVNEDFRQAVFTFFHLTTPDVITPTQQPTPDSTPVKQISSTVLDGSVSVQHLRIDSSFDYDNGVLYLYDAHRAESAYILRNGTVIALPPHDAAFSYVWEDVTYDVRFCWYEVDGEICLRARHDDPGVETAWYVSPLPGQQAYVKVRLTQGAQIDYTEHLLLYHLTTGEIIDVLADVPELHGKRIIETAFSPDLSRVLVSCPDADYLCCPAQGTATRLDDLTGLVGAWGTFLDNDTLRCTMHTANQGYTGGVLTLSTCRYTPLYDHLPELNGDSPAGLVFSGGRYGLYVSEDRQASVFDFQTGTQTVLDGFVYPEQGGKILASPTGDKLLFLQTTPPQSGGTTVIRLGIIDFAAESFTLFDREGFSAREEYSTGWFDANTAAVRARVGSTWYLYLYTRTDAA